jgi:lipopolysaccharide transport system ATP-binding protein
MTAPTVIHAESLGKNYLLGLQSTPGLRHILENFVRGPLQSLRRAKQETFWALRDVSLDVHEGEVVGLIGRNGAGKTTLLKILSRITQPTTGFAKIHGRVGSLLEVGTGFHPELTGRENTFLSGAILGMRKRDITRKFDEIVAFAEIEKFIDTPVKHYSSGMYVRLAFAVAAHLEPEILLVDEVLAVGDINFQKKCLGKMGDVARAGRTIVLVSHSMSSINALCSRCIILNGGTVEFDGPTPEATVRYYSESLNIVDGPDLSSRPRKGNGKARFTSISINAIGVGGCPQKLAYPGCDLTIDVELQCESDFMESNLAVIFYDASGYRIIDVNTAQKGEFVSLRAGETAKARFLLHHVLLRPGKYLVGLWLGSGNLETIDDVEHATTVNFVESDETSVSSFIYPGTYLCRFEQSVRIC